KVRIGSHSITYRGAVRVTGRDDGSYELAGDAAETRGTGSVKLALRRRLREAEGGATLTADGTASADGRITGRPRGAATAAAAGAAGGRGRRPRPRRRHGERPRPGHRPPAGRGDRGGDPAAAPVRGQPGHGRPRGREPGPGTGREPGPGTGRDPGPGTGRAAGARRVRPDGRGGGARGLRTGRHRRLRG